MCPQEDGIREDEEEVWEEPQELVPPDDQLELSEMDLKEELTRVLTADNPHAPQNVVRFNFKESTFKQVIVVVGCGCACVHEYEGDSKRCTGVDIYRYNYTCTCI